MWCLLVLAVLFVCQSDAYRFVCQKCAKDNLMQGFDNEEDFIKHSDWHIQQNENAKEQLIEDARRQQEEDDLRPKLFHCHHCTFIKSFNSSAEFIAHIDSEHKHTTIEENPDFIPQGKLKMKGYTNAPLGIPPEMANLAAENMMGPGYVGGGGGYGGAFDGVIPPGWGGGR
ncbi:uncharacterized protein LOC103508106 [Diaphorina citri]|uniref:Uncharacterized protein LOC103508106 n=1 Tax=Diaphorina citri TaxID=121845 RepID=A0A1S3D0L5_DIACI|nr:uncharacterized protein LOC103508106 [Diaphorina citri]KAI5694355.1 hypothetical protein M8J75_015514 [Diaphorina citri]KAI5713771.1 hypothetical protein M8J76_005103 [Diaphorina citri]KAI5715165.1 hypothetical protein M8J77_011596 [Diaphorina citri]